MPDRRLVLSCTALLAAAGLAGCGFTGSASSAAADRHAEVAATVMTRSAYPIPANDAAWEVVGSTDDTTIDAMALSGTLWDGSATLRITVELRRSGWGSDEPTTRCYRYTFQHVTTDREYHRVDCPTGAPLTLHPPVRPDLSGTGAARLAAALTALPHERRTAAAIQQVLTALYPPPVASGVTPALGGTGFRFGVGYTSRCMTGTVPTTGRASVTPQSHLTCSGG